MSMPLWKRVLAGLFGVDLKQSDDEAVIPYEVVCELELGDEAMNYQGAIFMKRRGSEQWSYEGQARGAPDQELAARGPMTMTEIERFFTMRRLYDLAGDI